MTDVAALRIEVAKRRFCTRMCGKLSILCARIANYIRECIQNKWWTPQQVVRKLRNFSPTNINQLDLEQFSAFWTLEVHELPEPKKNWAFTESQNDLRLLFYSFPGGDKKFTDADKAAYQRLADNIPLGLLTTILGEFNDPFHNQCIGVRIRDKYATHPQKDRVRPFVVQAIAQSPEKVSSIFDVEAFEKFSSTLEDTQRMSLYFTMINAKVKECEPYIKVLHPQIIRDLQTSSLQHMGCFVMEGDIRYHVRDNAGPLIDRAYALLGTFEETPKNFASTIISHFSKIQLLILLRCRSIFKPQILERFKNDSTLFQEKWTDQELFDFIEHTINEKDFPPCQEMIDRLHRRKLEQFLGHQFTNLLKNHNRKPTGSLFGFLGMQ